MGLPHMCVWREREREREASQSILISPSPQAQTFHPAVSGDGPPRGGVPPPPPPGGDGSLLGFPPQLPGMPVPGTTTNCNVFVTIISST